MIFLHGFLGCRLDWEPYVKHFSSTCTSFAPDLPGHGGAPFYELNELMEKLPKESYLVGYSMGGRIGLQLLHRYPGHFRGALILSANLGLETEEEKKLRHYQEEQWIEQLRFQGIEPFIRNWYKNPLFEGAPIPHYRYRQNPDLLIQAIRKFSLAKQQNFWNSLPKTTTFLYGENDTAYGPTVNRLSALGAPVHLVPNSSHPLHLQNTPVCIHHIEKMIGTHVRRHSLSQS